MERWPSTGLRSTTAFACGVEAAGAVCDVQAFVCRFAGSLGPRLWREGSRRPSR